MPAPRPASRPLPPRGGYTLLELMLVISVIAALAALTFPTLGYVRNKARVQSTRSLVQAVSTAISNYSTQTWTVMFDHDNDDVNSDGMRDGSPGVAATALLPRSARLWDLNSGGGGNAATGTGMMPGDGMIDGEPALAASETTDGPFWSALIKSGYTGFVTMSQAPIAGRNVNKRRQPVDAWQRPLRIAWSVKQYGASGFGVWSLGPKELDPLDDIRSWSNDDE